MFTRERRDDDGAALAALRGTQEPTVWQQQSSLSDMISINHLMKTCSPPSPSMLSVCPDHSILLIQGEAPVILWPIVPAIVLYLLYGTLVLTPPPTPTMSRYLWNGPV